MACGVGDIILVESYISEGASLGRHSFVVLSTEGGQIGGLEFDLLCNVMSSFKNAEQRREKMAYPGNFPITHDDCEIANGNQRDGFIKAEQLYYFSQDKLSYRVIGKIQSDIFELLIEFIQELDPNSFRDIVDNL